MKDRQSTTVIESSERSEDNQHWLKRHFPIILFGWFWLGLILCALLAPSDRVLMLKSGLITQGWHLAVLSVVLSTPVIWLYWRRS